MKLITPLIIFSLVLGIASADEPQCGRDAEGALCHGNLCCSHWGFCGTTAIYCDVNQGCQSQCWSSPPPPSPPPPSPPPPSPPPPSPPPPSPPPPSPPPPPPSPPPPSPPPPSPPPPSGPERPDHRCGRALGNPPCDPGRCCSIHNWCGSTAAYCRGSSCQYQCWNSLLSALISNGNNAISKIISKSVFDEMFKHMKDCPSKGFYSYDAFIIATTSFPHFGTTGDITTRKRELAAFFAQTSLATTGQRFDSQDPYVWGYCHINETTNGNDNDYCTSAHWPCPSGKKYNSRGAVQLTHNYNYGLAGEALGLDLINNPDLVATDPVISFKTAIWFWMAQHDNKLSCHDILINANSGYVIGNIIKNSGYQNGLITNTISTMRGIGYYKRYCDMLGVSYGDNLDSWYDQTHFSEVARM